MQVTSKDNSRGLESVKLLDDQGLVSELGGIFDAENYTFNYDVPDSYRGG